MCSLQYQASQLALFQRIAGCGSVASRESGHTAVRSAPACAVSTKCRETGCWPRTPRKVGNRNRKQTNEAKRSERRDSASARQLTCREPSGIGKVMWQLKPRPETTLCLESVHHDDGGHASALLFYDPARGRAYLPTFQIIGFGSGRGREGRRLDFRTFCFRVILYFQKYCRAGRAGLALFLSPISLPFLCNGK